MQKNAFAMKIHCYGMQYSLHGAFSTVLGHFNNNNEVAFFVLYTCTHYVLRYFFIQLLILNKL